MIDYDRMLAKLRGGLIVSEHHNAILELFVTWCEVKKFSLDDGLDRLDQHAAWLEDWSFPDGAIKMHIDVIERYAKSAA